MENFNILELIVRASIPVQVVMAILALASFATWVVIWLKSVRISRAERFADEFEERFWSGSDLSRLYDGITSGQRQAEGMERIFEVGFQDFLRMRQQKGITPGGVVEGAQRAMRIALARQTDKLELHLNFLATVGSVAPYVGLFGTVWGIMTSFQGLAGVKQATIQTVAPGISEALFATAMGLVAAIPAVIAYNRFANRVERLESRYDNFKEEFSSVLQRQAHALIETQSG